MDKKYVYVLFNGEYENYEVRGHCVDEEIAKECVRSGVAERFTREILCTESPKVVPVYLAKTVLGGDNLDPGQTDIVTVHSDTLWSFESPFHGDEIKCENMYTFGSYGIRTQGSNIDKVLEVHREYVERFRRLTPGITVLVEEDNDIPTVGHVVEIKFPSVKVIIEVPGSDISEGTDKVYDWMRLIVPIV